MKYKMNLMDLHILHMKNRILYKHNLHFWLLKMFGKDIHKYIEFSLMLNMSHFRKLYIRFHYIQDSYDHI